MTFAESFELSMKVSEHNFRNNSGSYNITVFEIHGLGNMVIF